MALFAAGDRSPSGALDDVSSLAQILARVHHICGMNTLTTAKSIGFTIGRDFALRSDPHRFSCVHSELSYLFRRLNLGRVIMHEWKPVVFVARPDLRSGTVEGAFGDGVLEGVMDVRLGRSAFVEHSSLFSTRQCVNDIVTESHRSVKQV